MDRKIDERAALLPASTRNGEFTLLQDEIGRAGAGMLSVIALGDRERDALTHPLISLGESLYSADSTPSPDFLPHCH